MIKKSWEEIIAEHTQYFPNGRYDILDENEVIAHIATVKSEEHMMHNEFYRSFGTYRHNILSDTSFIKINETYIDEKDVLDTFYDTLTNNIDYNFAGIVLEKSYSVNGNELSLEDLFAEYGYDFLRALDQSLIAEGREPKYFKQTTNDDIGEYYEILPKGTLFDDVDLEDSQPILAYDSTIFANLGPEDAKYAWIIGGTSKSVPAKYDGTYCPTIDEIISGELYIVIKSGEGPDAKINKVMFNNRYLPSMFINDDKHYNNTEKYLMEGQQTLKLCDIKLFSRIGIEIIWNDLIKIINLREFTQKLYENYGEDSIYGASGIKPGEIQFKVYFHGRYKLTNSTSYVYFITSFNIEENPANSIINSAAMQEIIIKEDDPEEETKFLDYLDVTRTTGKINMGKIKSLKEPPFVQLEFYFSISLLLTNYSLSSLQPERVILQWALYSTQCIDIKASVQSGWEGTIEYNTDIINAPVTNNIVDIFSYNITITEKMIKDKFIQFKFYAGTHGSSNLETDDNILKPTNTNISITKENLEIKYDIENSTLTIKVLNNVTFENTKNVIINLNEFKAQNITVKKLQFNITLKGQEIQETTEDEEP